MRTYTIIKTTALILALITASTTTAAALSCGCGDICVNETGWWRDGGAFNASTTPIQVAVDNAGNGETIFVWNGSYNENVNVNNRLTLQGEGADVVTVTAPAPDGDHVFEVTADYVNISGFTATGATGSDEAGIYLGSGVEHCNISDNIALNNTEGIYLPHSSNNMLTGNTASGNWNGIRLRPHSSHNTLMNNTASKNQCDGIVIGSSHNTLMNNIASKNQCDGIVIASSHNTLMNNTANSNIYWGIRLLSSSYNTLINNTADGNYVEDGIVLSSSSYNTLTGNTASVNSNNGIYLEGSSSYNMLTGNTALGNHNGIELHSSSNNTLTGNTALGNYNHGICLDSSSSNNITCNWVHNNAYAGFYLVSGSTDNNISYNNIIANGGYNATSGGWGWQFYNSQTNPIEARYNYWGAGMNNDTIDASIYDDEEGAGKVEFYPYETDPVPCAPIPELPTVLLLAVGLLALVGYVRIRRKT